MKRSVRHQWLPCHRPVDIETDVKVQSRNLSLLTKHGSTGGVFRKPSPIAHLVRGELLPGLGNLRHRGAADYLGVGSRPRRTGLHTKDVTTADPSGRNTLSGAREALESNGRKCNHSLNLS